ncbi:hypothetical protein DFS34DRAFT_603546 [Phlyctochytrium arcticum]|nr:hypothetical protein DFS34DRAFT_603546 [Phlyctochytrium arcticum]
MYPGYSPAAILPGALAHTVRASLVLCTVDFKSVPHVLEESAGHMYTRVSYVCRDVKNERVAPWTYFKRNTTPLGGICLASYEVDQVRIISEA